MASKNLLVLDEKAVASNRVKPSYMQKQGGASNGSADKTKSYDSPLILKANNSSSYKTLQTPELDKATGNDTPWYERVRNTLETGTAKAADALQIGMLKGEAGLFEAAGKVAEKVGAAGGRDAVNKSPFDWLYDKADEARAEEAAVRERAYAGTGKAGQFALQAIEGGSKLATDVAVSAMAGLPTMAVTGAGAFGSSAYEAEQEGATLNEALAYGAASAGLEAGIEKLTGGLDKIYGKSLTDDLVKGLVKRAGGNETAQWALQRLANAAGEGGEEALTSALSPFLKAIYDEGKAAKESYGTAEGRKGLGNEALYSAMLGAVIGAAGDLATGGLGEYPGGKSPLIIEQEQNTEAPKQGQKSPLIIEEDSTSVNTNPTQAPQGEQMQADGPSSEKIQKYVEHAIAKSRYAPNPLIVEEKVDDLPIGKVSPELAGKIKNEYGIDISGREHVLRDNDIRHMYNSHGPHTNEAEPLWAADIRMIPTIIAEANEVYYVPRDDGRAGLVYQYQYNGTTFYLEQIVDGENILLNKQMIKVPTGTVPDLPGLQEAIDAKKEVPTPAPGAADATQLRSAAGPQMYVQDVRGGTSDGTIPQNGPVVNDEAASPAAPAPGDPNAIRSLEGNPDNGTRTSQTPQTVRDSDVTPEDMTAAINAKGSNGGFDYFPITNNESVQAATETIIRDGWTVALGNWKAAVKAGKAGDQMTTIGALLYNNAVNSGDRKLAMDILMEYKALMGNTARGLQAGKIIQKLSPANRLYMIQKQVQSAAERFNLPDGITVSQELQDAYLDAKTEEERNEIITRMQKEVAKQLPGTWMERWNAIRYVNMLGNFKTQIRNVSGNIVMQGTTEIKNTLAAMIESAAYRGDSSKRTKAVVVGKELMDVAKADFDAIADIAMGESKYSLNDAEGFMRGVEDYRSIFTLGSDGAAAKIANVPLSVLEGYRKLTNWAMEKGDRMFVKRAYARALAGYLKAKGVTPEQYRTILEDGVSTAKPLTVSASSSPLKVGDTVRASDRDNYGKIVGANEDGTYSVYFKSPDGTEATVTLSGGLLTATNSKEGRGTKSIDAETATPTEFVAAAREYAVREAQESTFRDDNALSNWVSKLGRKDTTPKAVKVLSEGIMPFRKTPANVLLRAEEYSPLGLVNTAVKAIQARKPTSEITGTDVINSLAKSLTGTGIFAAGILLRNAGWLSGGEDDEKQAGFDSLRGEQEYALTLPDGTSITLDWVSPSSIPLFMGVQLADAVNDGGFQWKDLESSLTSIAEPMIQMSMLQGVNDTLDGIKYSDNNLMQIAASAAVNYLTQGLTNSLLGQAERGKEDQRMENFVDRDSDLPGWLQRSLGKASAKTPGWDYQQVDYVDAWGRTQDYGDGNLFNQFLNPSYVSADRSTAADDELQRLYDLGYTGVFPQRFAQSDEITTRDAEGNSTGKRHLTAEEYEQFNRTMGATRLELAEALIGSAQYKNMSNDEKAKAIENIYAVGKAKAMLEVDPNYKPDGWVREALEAKDPAKYIGLYSAAQKLQPWGDNESVAVWQRVKYVAKAAGKDADEYVPLFFDAGSNYPQKYRMARERGYSAERFAEFYEAYATIESDRDANGKSLENVRKKVIKHLVDAGWPEQYANEMYNLFKANKTQLNDWRW